tara:strand:- start:495 stop:1310 length:816 start_codon:yes stop_codon:yes gene_type:complete
VIENCINSIESEIEIIVVDNSNNDKFKERIETKYKNVRCILSKENLGMGGGNNLGIKNVNKDFALILNPDVALENNSMNELMVASKEIDDFGIIAPISIKDEYPNYILKKNHNFDPDKPFKVKSVDGYAMLLNIKKLKKIDNFSFFDENFFLYLENEDLCKRLMEKNENIYIIPKSKIHHLGGKAVDPKYKNEIEYLRNWHWMWSKFYFNKKHYGYFIALLKVSKNLISAKLRFFYYMITLNSSKKKIYQMRLLGLISSMRGKNSYFRIKI